LQTINHNSQTGRIGRIVFRNAINRKDVKVCMLASKTRKSLHLFGSSWKNEVEADLIYIISF